MSGDPEFWRPPDLWTALVASAIVGLLVTTVLYLGDILAVLTQIQEALP